MLRLWGKIIKGGKIVKSDTSESEEQTVPDALLECIEVFSRLFDIEAPMWHSQHTKQLGLFRKVIFRPDDFIDSVEFDRFEIQILDNDR